jgi:hypothetical protein
MLHTNIKKIIELHKQYIDKVNLSVIKLDKQIQFLIYINEQFGGSQSNNKSNIQDLINELSTQDANITRMIITNQDKMTILMKEFESIVDANTKLTTINDQITKINNKLTKANNELTEENNKLQQASTKKSQQASTKKSPQGKKPWNSSTKIPENKQYGGTIQQQDNVNNNLNTKLDSLNALILNMITKSDEIKTQSDEKTQYLKTIKDTNIITIKSVSENNTKLDDILTDLKPQI